MDETITPQEGTNPEVEVETTETTTEEETIEAPAEPKTYSEEEFKSVLGRAKKAEEQLKKTVKAPVNITNKQTSVSDEDVDVKILKSQGMDDELITELKAVAKARGKTILDSVQDPIFVAIKEQREATQKALKAKLGASKGSGAVRKEKGINSPGLSDEDHKALWKEQKDK